MIKKFEDIITTINLISSGKLSSLTYKIIDDYNSDNIIVDYNIVFNYQPFNYKIFDDQQIVNYLIGVNEFKNEMYSNNFHNGIQKLFEYKKVSKDDFVGKVTIRYNKNNEQYNMFHKVINNINLTLENKITFFIEQLKCNFKKAFELHYDKIKYNDNIKQLYDKYIDDHFLDYPIDDQLISNINKYTFGIFKHLLLNKYPNNLCFSGGLLHDCIANKFNNTYQDIDLFLIGQNKQDIIIDIINNLRSVYGQNNIFTGYYLSVIYIFIVGVSRIVQIVCCENLSFNSVISSFDQPHLMTYFNDNKIKIKDSAILAIKNKKTDIKYDDNVFTNYTRIKKTLNREYKIDNLINYSNIVIKKVDHNKYFKHKSQIEFYNSTNNLLNLVNTMSYNKMADKIFNVFGVKELNMTKLILNGNFYHYNNNSTKLNTIVNSNQNTDVFYTCPVNYHSILVYGKVINSFTDTFNEYFPSCIISLDIKYQNSIINIITEIFNSLTKDPENNKFYKYLTYNLFHIPVSNINLDEIKKTHKFNIETSKQDYKSIGIDFKVKTKDFIKQNPNKQIIVNKNYLFKINIHIYMSRYFAGISFLLDDLIDINNDSYVINSYNMINDKYSMIGYDI